MISQKYLNRYREEVEGAKADASNYVKAVMQAYMIVNPAADVAELRDQAIQTLQDGLYVFGDQAKRTANELFETLAQQNNSDATTQIYDNIDSAQLEGKVRYYANELKSGNTNAFVDDCANLMGYYVKREAFENMRKNCNKNNIRYARVPSGRETCPFCYMLASRGFVYWTKEKAGQQLHGNEYHVHCDCIIVPGFGVESGINQDAQIEGYYPNQMYDRYKQCYNTINPDGRWTDALERWEKLTEEGKTNDTWATFKTKELAREINTRDWGWLWSGKVPEVTFETEKLEKEIKKKRSHELETAQRLVKQGVRADFRTDCKEVVDEKTGRRKHVGLSDFFNGYEIKTLKKATSYNTINSYLKNASKKDDCKAVVFDNTNNLISNGELEDMLTRSRRFREGRMYILDAKDYWRIK